MIVFRLSKAKYANDLSGKGAELAGGRWNSKGIPVVYTSASRALCTTEIAVHTPLGNVPSDYYIISIRIPDTSIVELPPAALPPDWKVFPHSLNTQTLGDQFVRDNKHLVLRVPSAVVQGDFNYIINVRHPEFPKVKITDTQPFPFDERLFKK
jgi:RES domain-containing protein